MALDVPFNGALEMSPPACVSFPWLRLIIGFEHTTSASTAAMLEVEALQTYLASPKLQEAVGYADPEEELDEGKLKAMLGEMSKQGSISHQLRQRLETGLR